MATDDWMTPEQVRIAGFYLTWTREDHSNGRPPELVEVWSTTGGCVVVDTVRQTYTKCTSDAYAGVLFTGPITFQVNRPKVVKDPFQLFEDG